MAGFQPENLLSMSVTLPSARYPESEAGKTTRFFDELTSRLVQISGVRAVGGSTAMPIANWGGWGKYFTIDHRPASRLSEVPVIQYRQVTPDYHCMLGIRLVEGRYFNEQDGGDGALVAVTNESARRRYFANESPIGKRVFPATPEGLIKQPLGEPNFRFRRLTIVGVVGDVRHTGLMQPAEPEMYVLHRQGTSRPNEAPATKLFLFLRTDGDPLQFSAAVRALDPEQPVSDLATMRERLETSVAPQRFQLFLFGSFAAVGLALAAVGVYGVMSCLVRARMHEIGIRTALGASTADVLGMVVRHGLGLGVAGIVLGTLLGLVVTRLMSSLLFGIQPNDATTFFGAAAVLATVVFAASLLPSLRAARTDPLSVLRSE
jgi:predicted permease